MLKIRSDDLVIFGLAAENIALLQEGHPITFDGDVVGLPGLKVVIIFGMTEEHIIRDLFPGHPEFDAMVAKARETRAKGSH